MMKNLHIKLFCKELFLASAIAFILSGEEPAQAEQTKDPSTAPLLSQSNMSYLGALGLPEGDYGESRFGYSGNVVMPYQDAALGKETLFIGGHGHDVGTVAQVVVPDSLVKSSDWNALPVATVRQNFVDLVQGQWITLGEDSEYVNLYGLLPYNGRLIIAGNIWYDASCSQNASHGVANLNLSATVFQGFKRLSGASADARSLGGYMTEIPSEWRSSFGGPALTGNSALSIISCISAGPAASVFNPDDIGVQQNPSAQTVVYYPYEHYLHAGVTTDNSFTMGSRAAGMAFPRNSRSVLFVGVQSMAEEYCYGETTADPSMHLVPIPGGEDTYCYDPCGDYKGGHGYPYVHYVWAYDALDLLQVKNGTRQPWEIAPYATWELNDMDTSGCSTLRSAGFNPENGRLYITREFEEEPRVDVYQITSSSTDTTPPSAPQNVLAVPQSESRMRLTWASSTDNYVVASYNIERCLGEDCSSWQIVYSATSQQVSWEDTGLSSLSTYRYRISAIDTSDNTSDYSSVAAATTPANIWWPTSPSDSDGDGVDDEQEALDGTNPLDAGNYLATPQTRFCSEWNSFLGMWNILEQVNLSERKLRAKVELFSIDGQKGGETDISILPGAQVDVLVHDLPGFVSNSYGMVCTSISGNAGDLDGRMVYYRPSGGSGDGSEFDFAFAMPFLSGVRGRQYVPFNTYQPSLDPLDQANIVANWIQVSNLHNARSSGTLIFFDMNGQAINSERITLNAGARRDISGHDIVGPSKVGIIEWIPDIATHPFYLRNIRYYYGANVEGFASAFQLEGSVGTGEMLSAPLDTEIGSSIVEISNTLNERVRVQVDIYSEGGEVRNQQSLSLPAKQSRHIIVDSYLGGQLGTVTIRGSRPNSVVAIVMQYARNTSQGINNIYGLPSRSGLGASLRGSYNTFLNQGCMLRLVNPTSEAISADVGMRRYNGFDVGSEELSIPAKGLVNYDLCSRENDNVYGVVRVLPQERNSLTASVIRIGNVEQYRFPTPVR